MTIKSSTEVADTIIRALKRAVRADIRPFNWTYYSKDGTEVVNFHSNKARAVYTYTKTKKFLWFVTGTETMEFCSNDSYMDWNDWQRIGVVVNEANVRFGVN